VRNVRGRNVIIVEVTIASTDNTNSLLCVCVKRDF